MNQSLNKLYKLSPIFIQNLMVSGYGYRWKNLRFGGGFRKYYDEFCKRERFSLDDWNYYITVQLRSLLMSAFDNVPYYKKTWQGIVTTNQLTTFSINDLQYLPVLAKTVPRDDPYSLLIGGHPHKQHMIFHTSGSTGTPIATYWLPEELRYSLALREARSCKFAGVSYKMPRGTFSGRLVVPKGKSRGPYHRFNWFEKQVYFSAFHLSPQSVRLYIDALWRHNTQWLTGYSNSIYQLALLAQDQDLDCPSLKAIITTSEKVTDEMRSVIEQVFSTKVYEEYGTVEDLFYVCECEYGYKHINPDAGIIEIVDENLQPVPPGTMGEVLATGFIRSYQPMIRFRVGDTAILDTESCPCGRQMPVLKEVVGRVEDTIYGPDGRRMLRFHGIFINQPNIKEGQIIQETLNLVRVKVVTKAGYSFIDEQEIIHRLQNRLTNDMKIVVETVDFIERTSAGKFPAVINNLSNEEVEQIRFGNRN